MATHSACANDGDVVEGGGVQEGHELDYLCSFRRQQISLAALNWIRGISRGSCFDPWCHTWYLFLERKYF